MGCGGLAALSQQGYSVINIYNNLLLDYAAGLQFIYNYHKVKGYNHALLALRSILLKFNASACRLNRPKSVKTLTKPQTINYFLNGICSTLNPIIFNGESQN